MRLSTLKGRVHLLATQWTTRYLTDFSSFMTKMVSSLEQVGSTGLDGAGAEDRGDDGSKDLKDLLNG